jgi:glycosyltransferase involved in cell wall biosynthesis
MSDTVRVLMVIPQYPPPVIGGMERQAHELSKALPGFGVLVRVLSGRFSPEQPRVGSVEGVEVHRVPFPASKWVRFPLSGLGLVAALWRLRHDFDVMHVHALSWFGALPVMVAKLLRKPVLAKLPTGIEWAFRRRRFRFLLFQRCDAIALLAPDVIEEFIRIGFPESRIFKITNGVALGPERAAANDDRSLTLIFVGRLDPEKGLADLVSVLPAVRAACSLPLRLVICGEGPYEAELRRKIRSADIEDVVELRGHVSDVRAALEMADVFVLPSDIEGNSNAILEAMAVGLPIVSTAVGGTPLLVGPDGHRWLHAPRDRDALETLLLGILDDREARVRLGASMRSRVRDLLSIEVVAERYAAAYRRLSANDRDSIGVESSPVFEDLAPACPSGVAD